MNARDVIAVSIFDLLTIARGEFPSARADAILAALDAAGFAVVPKEPTEAMRVAAEAERDRLKSALERCQAIGCSQVKEIAQRAISSLPISDCSCKIEMGSFRFRGSHCIVCGGVIG